MKKFFIACGVLLLIALSFFVIKNYRALQPAILPPGQNIVDILQNTTVTSTPLQPGKNNTQFPLHLPDGFEISLFAKNLSGARVMLLDPIGRTMWVSRTSAGKVTSLDIENNKVVGQTDIFSHLKKPHGLAYAPLDPVLYVAEEDKISYIDLHNSLDDKLVKFIDLPKGGRHFTRSLLFDQDGTLFVSIGSTCDVCTEKNTQNATIMKVDTKAKKLVPFSVGLRNSVFMALEPVTGNIWATEMGRDYLGDNTPPDEINVFDPRSTETKNYGWPNCYGKNIHDDSFDKNIYIRNPCMEPFETPSYIDLPAHSAPLGLTFIPSNSQWPKEYWNNLLVAYHGSWNRSEPTGYKIVRYHVNDKGEVVAPLQGEDFITGWLTDNNQALGRPVGLLATKEGILYVSDDKAGVIYKVEYKAN